MGLKWRLGKLIQKGYAWSLQNYYSNFISHMSDYSILVCQRICEADKEKVSINLMQYN